MLVFVFAVWALQLWWSEAWLSSFLFGPAEWLWRVATYRSRTTAPPPAETRGAQHSGAATPLLRSWISVFNDRPLSTRHSQYTIDTERLRYSRAGGST